MARIVIDIPDEDFYFLREAYGEVELKSTLNLRLQSAVAHGIVLPEDYGDLISRNALKEILLDYDDKFITDIQFYELVLYDIDTAPTVIEADKENKE